VAFEGRNFGILAFVISLQCVSVTLVLIVIQCIEDLGVASWRGGTTDLCPGWQKSSCCHCCEGFSGYKVMSMCPVTVREVCAVLCSKATAAEDSQCDD